jgi:hypothetical protein
VLSDVRVGFHWRLGLGILTFFTLTPTSCGITSANQISLIAPVTGVLSVMGMLRQVTRKLYWPG